MIHFRIIFIILTLTFFLIFAVQIRAVNSYNFYQLRIALVENAKLKQGLYHKRIKLENMTSTSSISAQMYNEPEKANEN
jgi:hypothetical protein